MSATAKQTWRYVWREARRAYRHNEPFEMGGWHPVAQNVLFDRLRASDEIFTRKWAWRCRADIRPWRLP